MSQSTILRCGSGSGKWSTDDDAVAHYLAANARRYKLHMFGTTESQQRGILNTVTRALGEGWDTDKAGEYIVGWRTDTLRRIPRPMVIWHLSGIRGLIAWRQMRAAVIWFTIIATGTPLRWMESHTPSGVQNRRRWRWANRLQVAASRQGHKRWGDRIERAHHKRPALVQVAAGDLNVDQHLEVWLDRLELMLGAESVWRRRMPEDGSHGDRLIDGAFILGGRLVVVEVLDAGVSDVPKPRGYDHDFVWFTLRITVL